MGWSVVVAMGLVCGAASSVSASVTLRNSKPEQTLISKHVPSEFRSVCTGNTATFKKSPPANLKPYVKKLLASVNCQLGGGQGLPDAVTYQQFADVKSMNALYSFNLAASNVQIGANASATTCPKEEGYGIGSSTVQVGDFGCAPPTSSAPALLFWTNNRLKILGVMAATSDPNGTLLLNFFHTGTANPVG